MATFRKHKARDGSVAHTATVRVRPYPSASKTFTLLADARDWAGRLEQDLRKQREGGEVREDVTQLKLSQLIKEFLEDPQTTSLRYFDSLSLLLAWWTGHHGATKVLEFKVLTLRGARDTLKRGRAAGTVNRYMSAMRSAWNWGRAAGLVPQDRAWPARLMLTEPKGRTRYLNDAELGELLKAAAALSPVMHAAVLVSIGCGVRQSELRRLKWTDVDLDKQRLRVILSKNNESRSVYMPKATVDALRVLKRAVVVGQTIITDDEGQAVAKEWLEYRWRLIRDAAKLADFRWHDMRHSCASFLAQQGANLLEIGSVLGHRSPSVTMRYSHLIDAAPVTGHVKLDEKLRGL